MNSKTHEWTKPSHLKLGNLGAIYIICLTKLQECNRLYVCLSDPLLECCARIGPTGIDSNCKVQLDKNIAERRETLQVLLEKNQAGPSITMDVAPGFSFAYFAVASDSQKLSGKFSLIIQSIHLSMSEGRSRKLVNGNWVPGSLLTTSSMPGWSRVMLLMRLWWAHLLAESLPTEAGMVVLVHDISLNKDFTDAAVRRAHWWVMGWGLGWMEESEIGNEEHTHSLKDGSVSTAYEWVTGRTSF